MTDTSLYGISRSTQGGHAEVATMANGLSYTIHQEDWNAKSDYYLHTFVHYLSEIMPLLREEGNPLQSVLEMGIARGVLSIGVALLTDANTRIVGVDIEARSKELVAVNAAHNGVENRIEVRIGDMFAPLEAGETFDFILSEMPFIPVAAAEQAEFIAQGHASEILNISGGPDGRKFIDKLISDGAPHLAEGGSLVFVQPSFIGVEKTLDMLAQQGLQGRVIAQKPWRLDDTKFTRRQKPYIEATTGYTFPTDETGNDIFYITLVKGTR